MLIHPRKGSHFVRRMSLLSFPHCTWVFKTQTHPDTKGPISSQLTLPPSLLDSTFCGRKACSPWGQGQNNVPRVVRFVVVGGKLASTFCQMKNEVDLF